MNCKKGEKIIKKGFGVVELLIAIVIIAVLSSLYFLSFSGSLDKVKLKSDEASLVILNSATKFYKESYPHQNSDIFCGIDCDNDRLQMLVNKNCLSSKADPQQPDAKFAWSVPDQLWVLNLSVTEPALSPLGNTFGEISPEMINLIMDYYARNGRYLPTWGDRRYTEIGLDPSDWNKPINHIVYTPQGSILKVEPEDGYSFFFELTSGEFKELTGKSNWTLIYNDLDKKWYHHSIKPENEVNIETIILPE